MPHHADTWVVSLGRRVDLRVLLVGSLLPDMIDKPIGLLLSGMFGYRLPGHSLLFLAVVAFAGLALYFSRHKNWLLVLAFGVFMHLVLDEMWLDTKALLWPLQGFSFPRIYHTDLWHSPASSEGIPPLKFYISEGVGMAVLGWIAWVVVRRGKVRAFIRRGLV